MNYALILAGGVGSRMGAGMPKQFLEVCGKPVLVYTLEAFSAHPEIDAIFIVCIQAWQEELKKCLARFHVEKVAGVLPQGGDRRESSYIGVKAVFSASASPETDLVLIHDAARPLVTGDMISRNIADARRFGACETVCPMTDTVLESGADGFAETVEAIVPRGRLARVQTPQSFRLTEIMAAHEFYREALRRTKKAAFPAGRETEPLPEITDDAGLMLYYGKRVYLTEGSSLNIKLTGKEDVALFEAIVKARQEGSAGR